MKLKSVFSAKSWMGGLVLASGMLLAVGCSENIDDSNYAIANEQTMTDFIGSTDSLSHIKALFDRVRLGNSSMASTLTSVLSARGNYTVFAPTNTAMEAYVYELTGSTDIAALSDEQAQMLAYNCIIDNGDDAAYETPDFPTQGAFNLPNLNDRLLSCMQDMSRTGSPYVINNTATVIKENITVSNGVCHIVDAVINLSSNTVAEMIQECDNMQVMGNLLSMTGLMDSLAVDRDSKYEEEERDLTLSRSVAALTRDLQIPQKRYLGFTGFVETDDVYESEWGISISRDSENKITNMDAVLEQVRAKVEPVYGTEDRDDLTSPNNAVNRFVAYHFVKGKMAYNHLVTHYAEYGYQYGADPKNPQSSTYSVDVWAYYVTVGAYPDMVKVLQVPSGDHEIYLNRVSQYNDGYDGDFQEISTMEHQPGVGINIKVSPDNGDYDNNALNGYFFPIDGILLKNSTVSDALGGERIRFDMTNFLPEMASNSLKGGDYTYLPAGYLDGITNESNGTYVLYLFQPWASGSNWTDYEGDEFIIAGLFDFVLKIPPVPKSGTYEIRLGVSQNSLRGMAQVYFGTDPYRLQPIGLPIDMRQSIDPSINTQLNWQDDVDDIETNIENDKNLRLQGYMKGPMYYTRGDGTGANTLRSVPNGYSYPVVRRIVGIVQMEAHETYYMRFKSALKKTDAQFFLDYFEYCPTIVYNGSEAEDPW